MACILGPVRRLPSHLMRFLVLMRGAWTPAPRMLAPVSAIPQAAPEDVNRGQRRIATTSQHPISMSVS